MVQELTRLEQIATLIKDSEAELLQTNANSCKTSAPWCKESPAAASFGASKGQYFKQRPTNCRQKANRKVLEKLITEVKTLLDNSPRKNDARPLPASKASCPPCSRARSARFWQCHRRHLAPPRRLADRHQEGSKVRAIHHGRVVYSDWLRGYGLILLIDHGQGYLSLYAHNQSLLRDVGNWVNQGDVIASAGHSGGNDSSALYFEIRYNGRPQNPASWIQH